MLLTTKWSNWEATRGKAWNSLSVVFFAALVAIFGLVPSFHMPFIGGTLTFQSLGVMFAGSILGAKRGGLAVLLFVLLAATGLPILTGQRVGHEIFLEPVAGFVLSWPLAAFSIGLIVDYYGRRPARQFWHTGEFFRETGGQLKLIPAIIANLVGGVFLIHVIGIIWSVAVGGIRIEVSLGISLTFFAGDLIKAIFSGFVAVYANQFFWWYLREYFLFGEYTFRSLFRNIRRLIDWVFYAEPSKENYQNLVKIMLNETVPCDCEKEKMLDRITLWERNHYTMGYVDIWKWEEIKEDLSFYEAYEHILGKVDESELWRIGRPYSRLGYFLRGKKNFDFTYFGLPPSSFSKPGPGWNIKSKESVYIFNINCKYYVCVFQINTLYEY